VNQALSQLFQEELYHYTSPFVVVLSKEWTSYSEEDQMLLRKILGSVKVDFNTIQIVAQPLIDLKALQIYRPSKILMFGANCTDGDVALYQSIPAQGFTVIRADDLSVLDEQKKKNLWLALRQMFGI
jgi:hypothetical protein